jgi:multicomponent Na+:H+ antiporter subunit B
VKAFGTAVLVLAVYGAVIFVTKMHDEQLGPTLFQYIVHNFNTDTAAENAVSSILLNYRMYDTMFEALILLTAIMGMKQFLPSSHELEDVDREKR